MSILDILFGKQHNKRKKLNHVETKPRINEVTESAEQHISALLKQATKLKQEGKTDDAIQCLRDAFAKIKNCSEVYSIDTYLRLPLYLQQAGRNDEAWSEFNNLLINTGQLGSGDTVLPMDHSKIYDKMRLFLQREKRFLEAVRFGILSYFSWAIGLELQGRFDELCHLKDSETVEHEIIKLLKKTDRVESLQELTALVTNKLETPSTTSLADLARNIDTIIYRKD